MSLVTKRATIRRDLFKAGISTEAVYDAAFLYRYYLCWRWSDAPALYFWLLNPSTADHKSSDNTLEGLISRAKAWGYGAVVIINLFGFRSTQPDDMKRARDPVGPFNDSVTIATLAQAFAEGSPVVCGWGNHGNFVNRDQAAADLARQAGVKLFALEINSGGQPKHPLYIAQSVKPFAWA